MQILRLFVQISVILLVIFFGFSNGKIGNYLVPFILFFGVFYCGWICPFGSIQDIIGKIAKKLKIKRFKCPQKVQKYLVYLRYFLYTLVFIKILSMSWNPRGRFGDILNGIELNTILYIISILSERSYHTTILSIKCFSSLKNQDTQIFYYSSCPHYRVIAIQQSSSFQVIIDNFFL